MKNKNSLLEQNPDTFDLLRDNSDPGDDRDNE